MFFTSVHDRDTGNLLEVYVYRMKEIESMIMDQLMRPDPFLKIRCSRDVSTIRVENGNNCRETRCKKNLWIASLHEMNVALGIKTTMKIHGKSPQCHSNPLWAKNWKSKILDRILPIWVITTIDITYRCIYKYLNKNISKNIIQYFLLILIKVLSKILN